MDVIIGRGDKKKVKKVKEEVKEILDLDTNAIGKALDDLTNLLHVAYTNKPSMEIYDAQIHLDQLRRSVNAAKL